jgi:hypothetical protein
MRMGRREKRRKVAEKAEDTLQLATSRQFGDVDAGRGLGSVSHHPAPAEPQERMMRIDFTGKQEVI